MRVTHPVGVVGTAGLYPSPVPRSLRPDTGAPVVPAQPGPEEPAGRRPPPAGRSARELGALLASAVHPAQIGIARLFEGVGAAAFVPTALGTIAAATSPDRAVRARASGAFEGATLTGYAGGFLVGPLFYHSLGRGCFLVLAA